MKVRCLFGFLVLALVACGEEEADLEGQAAQDMGGEEDAAEDMGGEPDAAPDMPGDMGADMPEEFPPGWSQCGGYIPRSNGETPEACGACVDASCCEVARTCGEDAGCLALRECFVACALGDLECEAACEATIDEAVGALNGPMVMCRNTMCATECLPLVDWTCLGSPEAPPVTEAGMIEVSLTLLDFQTGAPAVGATVKVCARGDALCAAPQSEGVTGAGGEVALMAERGESGFRGYLEITGGGRAASHLYFSAPLLESGEYSGSAISESTLGLFTGLLQVEQDPARAAVAVRVTDCSRRLAPGIVLGASTADDTSQVGYLKGALPDPAATETDRAGLGGIFNLPPGPMTLTGTRADGTPAFEVELTLREGFLSVLTERPNR